MTGLTEILLAPAQRIELLVTANTAPNGRHRLRALRYEADFLNLGTYRDVDLLTLATTNEVPAPPLDVPSKLRAIEDLGEPSAHQLVELNEVRDLCTRSGATMTFLINNRIFDLDRVDLTSIAGRVELWDIVNRTAMAHPFHIHGTQFQLVSRQLEPRDAGPLSRMARYRARAVPADGNDQGSAIVAGQADVPLPHSPARGQLHDGNPGRATVRDSMTWRQGRRCFAWWQSGDPLPKHRRC